MIIFLKKNIFGGFYSHLKMLPNLDFLDEIIKQTQMMTDKEIITQIMLFPALFDASNNLFKNNEYQKTTWTKIANNLKQDVSEIKNRWCSIRQTLNNQLNFKKTANPHEIIDYEEELLPLILLLDPGYVKSANLQEISATSPFEPQFTPEVLKTPENWKPSKKTSNPLLIKNKNPKKPSTANQSGKGSNLEKADCSRTNNSLRDSIVAKNQTDTSPRDPAKNSILHSLLIKRPHNDNSQMTSSKIPKVSIIDVQPFPKVTIAAPLTQTQTSTSTTAVSAHEQFLCSTSSEQSSKDNTSAQSSNVLTSTAAATPGLPYCSTQHIYKIPQNSVQAVEQQIFNDVNQSLAFQSSASNLNHFLRYVEHVITSLPLHLQQQAKQCILTILTSLEQTTFFYYEQDS